MSKWALLMFSLAAGAWAQQAAAPLRASQPAAFSVPVAQMGYSDPGMENLGRRMSLVSLDFLDEDRLLFSFRAPGLVHRNRPAEVGERRVRAVVLSLPEGAVQAEALWTLQDADRYVWPLGGGHFALRSGAELREGDASLELKPYLRFGGTLLSVEVDPTRQLLATVSREAEGAAPYFLRIVKRDGGKVLLQGHSATATRLAINGEGYLEAEQGNGPEWWLKLQGLNGESRGAGRLISACAPRLDFLTAESFLATICTQLGDRKLEVRRMDGEILWSTVLDATEVEPHLTNAPESGRLALETVVLLHAPDGHNPISVDEVRGRRVRIFDAQSGRLLLEAPASAALDGGGSVAISPSGGRVAVLNGAVLDVYTLPVLDTADKNRKTR